ncbi:retinitis pigmentosa 1-like 1 protein [Amphibalanus amphitrite]|uniref:retinitis pigmentosa 1-like 1 protein n=1 Tax=Amphibalanus amphitrite TaxID=1232801 RepID=UPI001C90180A|nr:retinitis pigmentosa 1-like 1 protein [Amphibalanus amphitrite]
MSSSRKIRLFSDVGAKMSMFDQRAKEHRDSQMINPFSEWGGAGTRRKLSREDPNYGRPVEGSKTAERGRLAQIQMIGDMVELCDMIYDCGIRSKDGRAAISFGDAFRLYSSINDKVVGLLMRGRKHKILDFEGEMLFQGRDDHKMIELLLPLNTIRHKYGMPERAGCGEVDHELLQLLAEQDRKQKQQRKQQRTRSVGVPPLAPPPARHQKSRSVDNGRRSDEDGTEDVVVRGARRKTEARSRVESGKSGGGAEAGGRTGEGTLGNEQGAAGGQAVGQEVKGATAADAAVGVAAATTAGTSAEGRLQQGHQEAPITVNGAEGGQYATFGSGCMDEGQDMPSILSAVLGDQGVALLSNLSDAVNTTSNADTSLQHCKPPAADELVHSDESRLPEIRVSQGHDVSTVPTSADSPTAPAETTPTAETECASTVGRYQGQGHMSGAGTSDLPGSVDSVTAGDASSVQGSCPAPHEGSAMGKGSDEIVREGESVVTEGEGETCGAKEDDRSAAMNKGGHAYTEGEANSQSETAPQSAIAYPDSESKPELESQKESEPKTDTSCDLHGNLEANIAPEPSAEPAGGPQQKPESESGAGPESNTERIPSSATQISAEPEAIKEPELGAENAARATPLSALASEPEPNSEPASASAPVPPAFDAV